MEAWQARNIPATYGHLNDNNNNKRQKHPLNIHILCRYAAIFGVVTNLGRNVYKPGDVRLREPLIWPNLISVIKNGPYHGYLREPHRQLL